MASNREGGIKIFKAASTDALEDSMNSFLNGSGDEEDPRKQILLTPQFYESGGLFYCMIVYRLNLNTSK